MKTSKKILAAVMALITLTIGYPIAIPAQVTPPIIITSEKAVESVSSPEVELPSSYSNWLWIGLGVLLLAVVGLAGGGGGGGGGGTTSQPSGTGSVSVTW